MKDNEFFEPSIMSQMSHELRTPLTGIFGSIHLLNKTTLTSQQKKYLGFILSSSKQLLDMESKLHNILKKQNNTHQF